MAADEYEALTVIRLPNEPAATFAQRLREIADQIEEQGDTEVGPDA